MVRAKATKVIERDCAVHPRNMPLGLVRTGILCREPQVDQPLELYDCDETNGKLFRTSIITKIVSTTEPQIKKKEDNWLSIMTERELMIYTLNSVYLLELI